MKGDMNDDKGYEGNMKGGKGRLENGWKSRRS